MCAQLQVCSLRPRRGLLPAPAGGKISPVELQDVLVRARRGDEAARAQLVERFYPSVRETVHRELALDVRRGRPWIDSLFSTGDIVHDVFLGVLRDLDEFQGTDERSFESYLATTIAHRLLDTIRFHQASRRDGRRVGRGVDLDATVEQRNLTSPTHAARRNEESSAIHEAMAELAPRDRELLAARFRHDASYERIAADFGFPSTEAARKGVRTARARLLVKLRAQGIDGL